MKTPEKWVSSFAFADFPHSQKPSLLSKFSVVFLRFVAVFSFCMLFSLSAMSQNQNTQTTNMQLASKYYQNGEYDKALTLYEDLYNSTGYKNYRDMYLSCLSLTAQFDAAEKFLRKELKKKKNDINLMIDLAVVLQKTNRKTESDEYFQKAKELALANESSVQSTATALRVYRQHQQLIDLYLEAKKKYPLNNYDLEIA
ncbi:MAG: hypothetical protein HUK15_02240, partial [Bacteroidales bacterium]|nr:hypothetical protein [Bacteroidales bacterium]